MDTKRIDQAVAHLKPRGEFKYRAQLSSYMFTSGSVDVVLELDYTIRAIQHKPYYSTRSNIASLYNCKMREWK